MITKSNKPNNFIKKVASHQKKWYAKWHTWVGFFSGSVLLLVTLTGSLLVYESELDVIFNEEAFTFEESDKKLSFLEIYEVVHDQIPEGKITTLTRFKDKNDAVVVFYKDLTKPKNSPYRQAIVDPYTGGVTKKRIYGDSIMGFIRHFHRTLLIDKSTIQYDQYSGERLLSTHHDFAHFGKFYLNWVTPIHYGTFGGTITRIIALIASLVASSMIVTGFIIWFGRWKKRKNVKA